MSHSVGQLDLFSAALSPVPPAAVVVAPPTLPPIVSEIILSTSVCELDEGESVGLSPGGSDRKVGRPRKQKTLPPVPQPTYAVGGLKKNGADYPSSVAVLDVEWPDAVAVEIGVRQAEPLARLRAGQEVVLADWRVEKALDHHVFHSLSGEQSVRSREVVSKEFVPALRRLLWVARA